MNDNLRKTSDERVEAMYAQCVQDAPNYGVTREAFAHSIGKTVDKYLLNASAEPVSPAELNDFLDQLQAEELFLAIACANGNERAWWEFDQQHRAYMERVARHLAKTEIDAQEVIDCVYVELYGTRVVDGERMSKFASYSGRGSLRGWLRTVIWHSLVDLHRASHDEVSLDEMTENVGEGAAQASFLEAPVGGEDEMINHIARERYRKATLDAIEKSFERLEDHEKLLLQYYHVENLKLREIARLVENEKSPLRGWFQRKSQTREKDPGSRIHESTVMRWLEKSYAKVTQVFSNELRDKYGLKGEEIKICLRLATEDLAGPGLYSRLSAK